jgi:16S rRNA (cytidine1402-2'-O)-methyltransferase
VRGTAAALAERYANEAPRGEVVLVLGPTEGDAAAGTPSDASRRASEPAGVDALRRLVKAGAKPRPAATIVAELTGGKANELYRALTRDD